MAKITLFLFIVILLIMIPAVTLLWKNMERTVIEQAHIRAQAIYQMIIIARQWVAENQDRIDAVPAVATKELAKYADTMATFRFHIASDRLINPENKATEFELDALKYFRSGGKEYSRVSFEQERGKMYNYAAPLFINESCLTCHGYQMYKTQDLRGVISISFPLNELETSLERTNKIMFYTVIIGLFSIVFMVCLLVYWMITRHLNVLTSAAMKMQQGDRVVTNIKTDDEIENLSEAFDLMSYQIASNEEILKAKLEEAVAKYVELVEELDVKNKKLGSLNQLKTDLLDSVAHEIRTPLTKILSYAELLNDPRLLSEDVSREKFASAMKIHINSIKTMFNDIITISRLEHEQHEYKRIMVNLSDMISEYTETFELDIKNKHLSVTVDVSPSDIIYVDGETFSIVIANLISNAIKYSRDGGNVKIAAFKEGDYYVITCEDSGVGIPEADIGHIFKRFHRGANVKKSFSGTGLGLSIAARIIAAHNGTIKIESKEGSYTRVTVMLPLKDMQQSE